MRSDYWQLAEDGGLRVTAGLALLQLAFRLSGLLASRLAGGRVVVWLADGDNNMASGDAVNNNNFLGCGIVYAINLDIF